jgi:hypothetical protein
MHGKVKIMDVNKVTRDVEFDNGKPNPKKASCKYMTSIEKSKFDDRNYKYLRLPNKMKVLLIEDPTLSKSVLFTTIAAGNLMDP